MISVSKEKRLKERNTEDTKIIKVDVTYSLSHLSVIIKIIGNLVKENP